ncbi:3074_t:CDS:1, partial [Racocetra persica]
NYKAIQEHDCHIQAFFILINQARLSSIYEKLQIDNVLQKWHYNLVRSEKDSREYSEKNYNKCKKYHHQPIDRNDSRCKIKKAILEI